MNFNFFTFELELELIRTQMAQKQMLRVEVGARALRNPVYCLIIKLKFEARGPVLLV